jgi:hypothetical protein
MPPYYAFWARFVERRGARRRMAPSGGFVYRGCGLVSGQSLRHVIVKSFVDFLVESRAKRSLGDFTVFAPIG